MTPSAPTTSAVFFVDEDVGEEAAEEDEEEDDDDACAMKKVWQHAAGKAKRMTGVPAVSSGVFPRSRSR